MFYGHSYWRNKLGFLDIITDLELFFKLYMVNNELNILTMDITLYF